MFTWLRSLLWSSPPDEARRDEGRRDGDTDRDVQILVIGACKGCGSDAVDSDVKAVREFWGQHLANVGDDHISVLEVRDATKAKIEEKLHEFVGRFQDEGWYFLHFSGHGIQEDAPQDNDEDDGKNELIVASDGNTIIDDWLKDVLVTKGVMKARGATLVAVFDCCTSGTILDLPHHRCNHYDKCTTFCLGVGQVLFMLGKYLMYLGDRLLGRASIWWDSTPSSWLTCHGFCQWFRCASWGEPEHISVLCISACPDGRTAWEDKSKGGYLTRAVLSTLGKNMCPRLSDLQRGIDAEVKYMEKMDEGRGREGVRERGRRRRRGKGKREEVDLNQRVQFASYEPLNMLDEFSFAPRIRRGSLNASEAQK